MRTDLDSLNVNHSAIAEFLTKCEKLTTDKLSVAYGEKRFEVVRSETGFFLLSYLFPYRKIDSVLQFDSARDLVEILKTRCSYLYDNRGINWDLFLNAFKIR